MAPGRRSLARARDGGQVRHAVQAAEVGEGAVERGGFQAVEILDGELTHLDQAGEARPIDLTARRLDHRPR